MAIGLEDVWDTKGRRTNSESPSADMPMMRIAVAGTGGLARLIAHYIDEDTSHHVVFLSRTVRCPAVVKLRLLLLRSTLLNCLQTQPQLAAGGYQVSVVDYGDFESLKYALRGIDTVISTVTGVNQIELIKAAVSARVRRFAPAEFEGLPQLRSSSDPLDRGRTLALQWLSHYSQSQLIQSTRFVCGILYERFQPGGLQQLRIGNTSGFGGEGAYIMDCRNMSAQVPAYDAENNPNVVICMTAAQDVARFVTKAVDMKQWPAELRMCGQRILVKDLVAAVQRLKGSSRLVSLF